MKKALVVAATAGFIKGFLVRDMRLLQEMGYEVHCASNAAGPLSFDPRSFFPDMGFPFHEIPFASHSPVSKENLMAVKAFRQLMKTGEFNVIHCHTPIVGAIVRTAAVRWRRNGGKILYTSHGLAFPKGSGWKSKGIYGGTEWVCAKLCDGVVTINRDDYQTMRRLGCRHVFHITGVGVDTARFHNVSVDRAALRKEIGVAEGDIMVLAVGELTERKNHQIIIKALAKLGDPRFVFVICGKAMVGGGTYDALLALAQSLLVQVRFLGFRTDIPAVTLCADVAVIPSIREGLGLAGIEALASGVPVVGSCVQGIKDYVVEGVTGFLCPPLDADRFAERIFRLSDPTLRLSMRDACMAKAEEFRTEISASQMRQIYQEVFAPGAAERK
jgi:glycosyltransferase involved in cell wall biosynthesis